MLLLFSAIIFSCNSMREIEGTYVLENNPHFSMHLILNKNGTFTEFVRGHNCEEFFYTGFYYKKRNKIILDQITQNLSHLGKRDTIMYFLNSLYKGSSIYVIENQKTPSTDTRIYLNGREIGLTNDKGQMEIVEQIQLFDSLRIERKVGDIRTYIVNCSIAFNQMFVFLYDYSFEPCSNFCFAERFIMNKKRLFFIKKGRWRKGEIFLRKN